MRPKQTTRRLTSVPLPRFPRRHILTFSPSALPSHEADCKRQLRPCAVCPPHHAHEMTYDDLRLHYRSKIRSVEHAVELLLMQSTGQTRVAVTSSIDACPPGGVSHYLPSPCKSPHGTVDPHRKIIIPSGSSVPSAAGSVASAPSPVDTKAATSFGPNSWALTKKPSTHAAASGVVSSAAVPAEPSAPEAAARPQARRAAPMSASSPTHAQTLAADSSSAPAAARLDVRSSSPVNTGAAAAWSHSSWATTTKPATPAPAHSARTSDAAHIAAANAVSPPHTATSAPPAYSSVAARTPMQPPSTGSMASPHSALTWPTPSPAHSSPAATTTVSASPCPAAHSAAFLTAPLPSSVPPVVHSEDHRRFVDSLVVGSFVEVFSKSNNTWKPARVTDVDFEQPDQLRLKALDGKKYLRPKMSTHIRRPEMPIPSPTALSANKKRKRAQSATAIDANAAHASTSAQPPVASHALSPVAAPPRTVAMLPVAPPTPAAEPVVAAIVATAVDPPAAEHFADGDVDAEEKEFDDGSANMDDDDRADRSDTADGADAESKQPHAAATTSSLALSPALVLTARERELQARWIMKLRLNSRVDYRDELEYHCWRVGRVVAIDHVKGILTVKPGIREKKDRREDPVAFDIKMAELLLTRPHTRSNNEQERYIQRCEQTAQEAKRRKFVDEVAAAAFTTTPGEEQQEGGGEDLGAPSDEPPSSPLESHPSAAAAADEDDGARDEF